MFDNERLVAHTGGARVIIAPCATLTRRDAVPSVATRLTIVCVLMLAMAPLHASTGTAVPDTPALRAPSPRIPCGPPNWQVMTTPNEPGNNETN